MRITIIGCGYVGRALGIKLMQAGHDVTGTARSEERIAELRALGMLGAALDVSDVADLARLTHDRDAVYLTVAAGRRGGDYRSVYLRATRNLVQALRGSRVSRVVYTSSSGVYGHNDGRWVDELTPAEPNSDRGRALLDAELALLDGVAAANAFSMTATVLRLSGIYGPGRDLESIAWRSAGKERQDGQAYLNMVHLDDIVAALTALLDVPYHGILNLSDDVPTSRREFYDALLSKLGAPPIIWRDAQPPTRRGKRIKNDRVKRICDLQLAHPSHGLE